MYETPNHVGHRSAQAPAAPDYARAAARMKAKRAFETETTTVRQAPRPVAEPPRFAPADPYGQPCAHPQPHPQVAPMSAYAPHSEPSVPAPENDLVADIGALFGWLWQGKGWIVAAALICALLASLIWSTLPTRFDATTSIMIDPRGLQVIENAVTPDTRNGEANVAIVESQKRVLISDAVLTRVVARENLAAHPEYGAKLPGLMASFKAALKALTGGAADREKNASLAALRTLRKNVRTSRVVGSFVLDLSVRAPDADLAARLANAIASEYTAYEIESRRELAQRANIALTSRLDTLRSGVVTAEDKVEAFKANAGIVGFNGRLSSEQQLSEITTQLANASAATARARSRFEQVQSLRRSGAGAEAIAEAVQSASVRQLRARYAAASQTAGALATQLRGRHPRLVAARAEVSDLSRQIGGELSRIERTAKFDYERAVSEERRLADARAKIVADATSTSGAMVELRQLERDADAHRQVFQAFLVRAREVGEQQALDTSVTRILSPAVPASTASSLSLKVALVLGLIAGLALGALIALVRGALRSRRRAMTAAMA